MADLRQIPTFTINEEISSTILSTTYFLDIPNVVALLTEFHGSVNSISVIEGHLLFIGSPHWFQSIIPEVDQEGHLTLSSHNSDIDLDMYSIDENGHLIYTTS